MRIFKTKPFAKWAKKEKLADNVLCEAVEEIEHGVYEATLGSEVFKKRIALPGHGKQGARSIIAFKSKARACFIFGYAKKDQANLSSEDKKAAREFAKEVLNYDTKQIHALLKVGQLIEVENNDG